MSGFIKLHRSILEWEWYDDINTTRLFTHLLLTANYKPARYQGNEVPAGSRVGGLGKLAEQTGLSVQSLRTSISRLKSTEELTVQNFGNFSIFTITNWENYQQDNRATNIETTSSQHDANTQVTTSKERKNLRREEEKKDLVLVAPSDDAEPPKPNGHDFSEKKPQAKAKRKTQIEDGWFPEKSGVEFAYEKGLTDSVMYEEIETFTDHHKKNASLMADWTAAWRTWVRNSVKFKEQAQERAAKWH